MGELVEKARAIATEAHQGQVRKDDGSPYIAHPIAVAEIVKTAGFSDVVIAAALVHDVLEDTDISEGELRTKLGDEVVNIVTAVSEDKSLTWEDRKAGYIASVVASNEAVWAVTCADKIHNTQCFLRSYAKEGPALWEKFNRGPKKALWFHRTLSSGLKAVWQHPLLDEYATLIKGMEALLD